jgi:hypothetical protein
VRGARGPDPWEMNLTSLPFSTSAADKHTDTALRVPQDTLPATIRRLFSFATCRNTSVAELVCGRGARTKRQRVQYRLGEKAQRTSFCRRARRFTTLSSSQTAALVPSSQRGSAKQTVAFQSYQARQALLGSTTGATGYPVCNPNLWCTSDRQEI